MSSNRPLVCLVTALVIVTAVACKSGDKTAQSTPVAAVATSAPPRAITAVVGPPATAEPTATPSPSATPRPSDMPATPTPMPRIINGLQIIDEVWVGIVREAGGLRIRSTPRVEASNVVGSVPQNAQVNVSGRVLNGQEAEAGKGTVWLIVGPNQYIYSPPGYIELMR